MSELIVSDAVDDSLYLGRVFRLFPSSTGQRSGSLLRSRRERKRFKQHTDEQRRVGPSTRVAPELFTREEILSARCPVDVFDRRVLHVQLSLR